VSDKSSESSDPDPGFTAAEKAVGAWAAYKHPVVSSLVANEMLDSETSPSRRRQLTTLRNAATMWWVVGLIAAVVGVVVIATIASSNGFGGGCRGGPDKFDAMNITYQSSDGTHWTATYPCLNGGSTTLPVPRRDVPGGG
jgi:hypothetical protein